MYELRIKAGVDYLNKNYPDWLTDVNPDTLNMRYPSECIIGQLTGNFFKVFPWEFEENSKAVTLGLALSDEDLEVGNYVTLTDEWKATISALTDEWKATISALRV